MKFANRMRPNAATASRGPTAFLCEVTSFLVWSAFGILADILGDMHTHPAPSKLSSPLPSSRRVPLGEALPDDPHAVSVSLPTWADNVGYEEGEPRVVLAMRSGYPRFFIHPRVAELFRICEEELGRAGEACFAFPSERAARTCAAYLRRSAGAESRVMPFCEGAVWVVAFPEKHRPLAKACWQHAGEIVSSRRADDVLTRHLAGGQEPGSSVEPAEGIDAARRVRERVAETHGCPAEDVWLFPSGMAAVFAAHRAVTTLRPQCRSVQFGFPYVDILKVQEQFGTGVEFLPCGSGADLERVAEIAAAEELAGVFCETPGNPLLRTPDLPRLRDLADRHNFPLVIDDTLGAMINTAMLPGADLVVTSLTKYFSGAGNVLAGALVLNRSRGDAAAFRQILQDQYENLLYPADAIVLERNSRDFRARVTQINATAATLCDRLRHHPRVERIYYPKYETPEAYRNCLRDPKSSTPAFGGLFAIVLRDPACSTPRFFDALEISKGPNLGTNFSLCCPYTLLAHYGELDFAERCGISRWLVRVSVGLEAVDDLTERFWRALQAASQA